MARKLRVQYPGAIYHVMNRGDRREAIFNDDKDRLLFLDTLAEVPLEQLSILPEGARTPPGMGARGPVNGRVGHPEGQPCGSGTVCRAHGSTPPSRRRGPIRAAGLVSG